LQELLPVAWWSLKFPNRRRHSVCWSWTRTPSRSDFLGHSALGLEARSRFGEAAGLHETWRRYAVQTVPTRGTYPQSIKNLTHIDEWGRVGTGQSQVTECVLEIDGVVLNAGDAQRDAYSVLRQTEEKILRPDQVAKIRSKSLEYKSSNDDIHFHFMAPTIDPEIEVRVSPELDCLFGFGTPTENIETLNYALRKRLLGTYFPHQSMRVRWWPKTEPKA